jgi:hypothetical protein
VFTSHCLAVADSSGFYVTILFIIDTGMLICSVFMCITGGQASTFLMISWLSETDYALCLPFVFVAMHLAVCNAQVT